MTKKKKPRKRRSSPATNSPVNILRRTCLWLLTSGVVAFQATSCGFLPPPEPASKLPSVERSGTSATSFYDCRQFFAGGVAPLVPKAPLQRELCYDQFAVLHSGQTRTPVFVAERLNRQSIQDARDEQRTNKFFADARLPRSERAELSDYRGSGYARGHMQFPVISILNA